MNSELVSYLQKRTEDAAKKLQSINEQIQKLNAERESLAGDIEGYKRTIIAETRGTTHAPAPAPLSISVIDEVRVQDHAGIDLSPNKAEFARQFVRGRAQFGVTPGDIFQGFRESGMKITKPYVYSLVQRLKAQGAIRQKRGKWFPVLESDNPMSPNGQHVE